MSELNQLKHYGKGKLLHYFINKLLPVTDKTWLLVAVAHTAWLYDLNRWTDVPFNLYVSTGGMEFYTLYSLLSAGSNTHKKKCARWLCTSIVIINKCLEGTCRICNKMIRKMKSMKKYMLVSVERIRMKFSLIKETLSGQSSNTH